CRGRMANQNLLLQIEGTYIVVFIEPGTYLIFLINMVYYLFIIIDIFFGNKEQLFLSFPLNLNETHVDDSIFVSNPTVGDCNMLHVVGFDVKIVIVIVVGVDLHCDLPNISSKLIIFYMHQIRKEGGSRAKSIISLLNFLSKKIYVSKPENTFPQPGRYLMIKRLLYILV
ncbi:hypothetical protein ACJX0J_040139, partial [Zea mays]